MKHTLLATTSTFNYHANEVLGNPHGRKLTEDELIALIEEHQPDAVIAGVEPFTAKAMDAGKNLRIIARVGVGMDSVDLEAAKARNIKVVNTPDAVTAPVAELTLGLMLSMMRRIHQSDRLIRTGAWERPKGNLLAEKTVGLIGLGRIGRYVADLCHAFKAHVLYFDPYVKEATYTPATLDELFSKSDVVSLHIPYSSENHHIVGADQLARMKEGSYLVNASRGGLVDEQALFEALTSGKLSGAALDCFEEEPYTGPLTQLDKVVLTGHIGSYAIEGRELMEKQAFESAVAYLNEIA